MPASPISCRAPRWADSPHPTRSAPFAFLAPDAAAFITGAVLPADGGYLVTGIYEGG